MVRSLTTPAPVASVWPFAHPTSSSWLCIAPDLVSHWNFRSEFPRHPPDFEWAINDWISKLLVPSPVLIEVLIEVHRGASCSMRWCHGWIPSFQVLALGFSLSELVQSFRVSRYHLRSQIHPIPSLPTIPFVASIGHSRTPWFTSFKLNLFSPIPSMGSYCRRILGRRKPLAVVRWKRDA